MKKIEYPIEITAKVKAFAPEKMQNYRLSVERDGGVAVYDPIAGFFTRCHILTPRTQRRIAARARKIWSVKRGTARRLPTRGNMN
jgi:hypothetical protein